LSSLWGKRHAISRTLLPCEFRVGFEIALQSAALPNLGDTWAVQNSACLKHYAELCHATHPINKISVSTCQRKSVP
jgi:hypothetical protein